MILRRTTPPVIKEFLIWLGIGLVFLVLQATWFCGEEINPFRLDLVFILVTLLGTLNQFGPGILISAFLGMLVDILSWDMLGLTLTLYPLVFLLCHLVWTRTHLQSLWVQFVSIFVLQVLYVFLVQVLNKINVGGEFTRIQILYILVQGLITMLIGLPLVYLHRFLMKKRLPFH
jgi:rod shape-determining protein MreD